MKNLNNPFFSIIIPAYNSEDSIGKCIDSIAHQTFNNFEVIIVNDGSTDRTKNIAHIKTKDNIRFMVLSQKNQGVSAARNKGLGEASGKYIVFVDSDDILAPKMLAELFKISDKNTDLLMCSMMQKSKKKETIFSALNHNNKRRWSVIDVAHFISNKQLLSPCAKAYSASLIKSLKLRFKRDVNIGEDLLFNLSFFGNVKRYNSSKYVGYIYNTDSSSSLTKSIDKVLFSNYRNLFKSGLEFCQKNKINISGAKSFAKYYLSSLYHGFGSENNSLIKEKEFVSVIIGHPISIQAAKLSIFYGYDGFILSVPVLLRNYSVFRLTVFLRNIAKKRVR